MILSSANIVDGLEIGYGILCWFLSREKLNTGLAEVHVILHTSCINCWDDRIKFVVSAEHESSTTTTLIKSLD